jgi:replication factor A1
MPAPVFRAGHLWLQKTVDFPAADYLRCWGALFPKNIYKPRRTVLSGLEVEMNFEQMVQRILESSGLSRDEVMSRIRAKQEELGGFVTLEGAANIVARELGIVFERREPETRSLRIEDLLPGMSKVELLARVVRVQEPREFQRPGGKSGQVGSMVLQDSTGEIRLVLWDEKAEILKQGGLKKGDIVRVQGAYVRQGLDRKPELSLGARGSIVLCPDHPLAEELPPLSRSRMKIAELSPQMIEVDVAGRVVTTSEVRSFDRPDGTTGKVATLILMDGTGQVRVSLWDEWAELAKELNRGEVVMLENAVVKAGPAGGLELSLGSGGRLVRNPPGISDLPELRERPLKIAEVEPDMRSLDLAARVRRVLPLREFKRSDGSTGRVLSVVLADDTGALRASFWDHAAELAQKLRANDVVLLRNAYTRSGLGGRPEIHAGRATQVEINPPGVEVAGPQPQPLKIKDLEPNLEAVEVVGRIVELSGWREFTRPDGSRGKVASLVLGDDSGTVRVSLWQEHAEKAERMKVGDVVRLVDAYTTLGAFGQTELHLGRQGQLELNPALELPEVALGESSVPGPERVAISQVDREGMRVEVRGTVIQVFHRRPIFEVCPSCGRSVGGLETSLICEECGKQVVPEHRAVVSLLLDDGTGNIRVALFGRVAERLLGMGAQQVFEALKANPDLAAFYGGLGLVGRELLVSGVSRRDRYFDQLELRAQDFQIPDPLREATMLLKRLKEMT